MVIRRDLYLDRLVSAKHDGFVKIVAGVRRCGKSYLLFKLFVRHLLACGVDKDHVIRIELDKKKHAALRSPGALYEYLARAVRGKRGRIYILIDEIQECRRPRTGRETAEERKAREEEFYDVLNEFREKRGVDLYVTGSNSRLLVTDVATQFRGRGRVVRVNPLTFSEYYAVVKGDKADAWRDYLAYGGMPECVAQRSAEAKRAYLEGLFSTIYFRDIVERENLPDDVFLGNVTDVLMSVSGSLTNPTRLAHHISSVLGRSADPHTVRKYLSVLENAYLFRRAERYDVKGRAYLDYPSKYYPVDLGLRNARLNFRQLDPGHLMECAIYNELIARGASVDVGVIEQMTTREGKRERRQLEIDFVVNLGFEKLYIQSAYRLQNSDKVEQESRGLCLIPDSFRKLIVVDGVQPFYTDEKGISHVGLMDFLLNPAILNRATDASAVMTMKTTNLTPSSSSPAGNGAHSR